MKRRRREEMLRSSLPATDLKVSLKEVQVLCRDTFRCDVDNSSGVT